MNMKVIRENGIAQKSKKRKKVLAIVAAVLVALLLILLAGIPFAVMPTFLGQRFEQQQYDPAQFGVQAQRITLTTDDALHLAAWRTQAATPRGTVVILSGIQNPSVTAFFGYAKMLADNGWDALLVEMRARSQSEGDEIGFGMTEWRDVKAGVDYLAADARAQNLPIVTMGTSMGAGTVLIAAGEVPRIDAVITASAFSSWSDLFVDNMSMFGAPKLLGMMDMPFLNLYLGAHFGFDALQYSPANGLAKLGDRPVLMMHSTGDTQVPYREFQQLVDVALKNKIQMTTMVRPGDEHFICYDEYFNDPVQDVKFSTTVLSFLDANFPVKAN
ncbi:MAG: alpha/beta hydrolase [Pygmaiobacter sp.]|nr:alpha/beta hydrolase [Pygmaiobacter sp.]